MADSSSNPTLQDIADRAGVSRMTVSLALRRSSRIKESTREKIEAIAEEMGYRPNPMVSAHMSYLRALKKVRPRAAIAFLSRWPRAEFFEEEEHFNIYRMYLGAKERASELGYSLEYHNLFSSSIKSSRLNQILENRGVEGLILGHTGVIPDSVKIDWSRYALATSQFSHLPFLANRTMSDIFALIETLVSEVWKYGYRRIGLVVASSVEKVLENRRISAFLGAINVRDPKSEAPYLLFDSPDDTSIAKWIRDQSLEAVITEFDVYETLEETGFRIPRDLGVALLNFPKKSLFESKLCGGYNHNFERVGASLVELVVEQLHLNERGVPKETKSVLITGEWRAGESLRQVERKK